MSHQMLQPLLGEQSEEGEGRFLTQTRGLGQRHLRKVAKNAMMPRENIWALARPFGMPNKNSGGILRNGMSCPSRSRQHWQEPRLGPV